MLMLFEKPCGGRIIFIIERFYSRKLTYRSKLIWIDIECVCVCGWRWRKNIFYYDQYWTIRYIDNGKTSAIGNAIKECESIKNIFFNRGF